MTLKNNSLKATRTFPFGFSTVSPSPKSRKRTIQMPLIHLRRTNISYAEFKAILRTIDKGDWGNAWVNFRRVQ